METQEQIYIKGFNYGYMMEKLEPNTLKDLLTKGKLENELLRGMLAGQKQYQKEQKIEMLQHKLQHSNDKDKSRDM